MNFQQLEYIIAVERHKHFVKAAESCFITQPTLSMMIQKLEDELGIVIFDRSRQPVKATPDGKIIIEKAKKVLSEIEEIKHFTQSLRGELKGELKIGIIPTLAPYLLPGFLKKFTDKYPLINVKISELTTDLITDKLKEGSLDIGIAATPINDSHITERPLFREEFFVYASKGEKVLNKKYLLAEDIDVNHLLLLEEGHCLRSQIINLCELRKKDLQHSNLEYEAGSIESLIKMVDMNGGITILPELAALSLDKKQKLNLRPFKLPVPVREISIITYKHFFKTKIMDAIKNEIIKENYNLVTKKKKNEVMPI